MWRIAFSYLSSIGSLPQIKPAVDVAADMSFGKRIFVVSLFLGIVLTRFSQCNQGEEITEFNEPLVTQTYPSWFKPVY